MAEDTEAAAPPATDAGATAAPADASTTAGKTVPLDEHTKLRTRAQAAEAELAKSQALQNTYAKVFADPEVRSVVQRRFTGGQPAAAPAAPAAPADADAEWDPYEPENVKRLIASTMEEQMRPFRDNMQRMLWQTQIDDAKRKYAGRFNWDRDQAAIIQKVTDIPNVTVAEAFALVDYDRSVAASTTGNGAPAGSEVMTGGQTPSSMTANPASTTLSDEERYVASRMGVSEDDYVKTRQATAAARQTSGKSYAEFKI